MTLPEREGMGDGDGGQGEKAVTGGSPRPPVSLSPGLPQSPGLPVSRSRGLPVSLSARQKKPVIGILGGIGSGKSLVAAELAEHGGYVIDADRLGHEALRQPDIRAAVVARWGQGVVDAAGEVDRRRLGRL